MDGSLSDNALNIAYDIALPGRVTDLLTTRNMAFETKAMMGGLCFMVHGKLCVGVEMQRHMVRLDPVVKADALAQPGYKRMDFTGRPMNGCVFVYAEGYEPDKQLRHGLTLALDFNPRAKASKKCRAE